MSTTHYCFDTFCKVCFVKIEGVGIIKRRISLSCQIMALMYIKRQRFQHEPA